jgi:hypothetical protein
MNSHKHARLTAKGRALLVSRVIELGKAASKGWSQRAHWVQMAGAFPRRRRSRAGRPELAPHAIPPEKVCR